MAGEMYIYYYYILYILKLKELKKVMMDSQIQMSQT